MAGEVSCLAYLLTFSLTLTQTSLTQTLCLNREQKPREGVKAVVNSFPKDRDYRQEAMQASATSALSSASKH